jgi:hypothetical protein
MSLLQGYGFFLNEIRCFRKRKTQTSAELSLPSPFCPREACVRFTRERREVFSCEVEGKARGQGLGIHFCIKGCTPGHRRHWRWWECVWPHEWPTEARGEGLLGSRADNVHCPTGEGRICNYYQR